MLERVWAWLHRTFPERQIYIRSDGRVQFFTFGPSLQATLAGLALIFLGWVAFATVNVVFKDRIIAAKDHRFQQMQSAYENRLADLQISYDELNGALVGAEDKFKATADALTAKQNAISGFLSRKTQVEAAIGAHAPAMPCAVRRAGAGRGRQRRRQRQCRLHRRHSRRQRRCRAIRSLAVMPGPVAPQPRVEKPGQVQPAGQCAWTQGIEQTGLARLLDRRAPVAACRSRAAYAAASRAAGAGGADGAGGGAGRR